MLGHRVSSYLVATLLLEKGNWLSYKVLLLWFSRDPPGSHRMNLSFRVSTPNVLMSALSDKEAFKVLRFCSSALVYKSASH